MKFYDVDYVSDKNCGSRDGVKAASLEEAALIVRGWDWADDITNVTISDPDDDSRIAEIFDDGEIQFSIENDGYEPEPIRYINLDNGNQNADMTFNDFLTNPRHDYYLGEGWELLAAAMDDEIREDIHSKFAPCSNELFLLAYLAAAKEDLTI